MLVICDTYPTHSTYCNVQVRRAVDSFISATSALGTATSNNGYNGYRSVVPITRSNLDVVADTHFPLCMRRIVRMLRREHHLKYQARLQLVSFLVNAGMEVRRVQ